MLCGLIYIVTFTDKSNLCVVVKNIQPGEGNIIVEIYNSEENFLNKAIVTKKTSASNKSLEFTFELPNGSYAVSAYQDLNENNQCDKNWFSKPTEPYGLSNNFRPKFSKPKFQDCKINLIRNMTEIITLIK